MEFTNGIFKEDRMKTVMFLFLAATTVYGRLPVTITPRDGVVPAKLITNDEPSICGTLIAACGDIRAILGPQGKNIAVCQHGDAIAVLYGAPTNDPTNNPMAVKIAYSVNQGATWTTYGPFTGNVRRIYGGTDGTPDFCTNPGEVVFCHMMRTSMGGPFPEHVLIEENVPSNPSISAPITPSGSESLNIFQTGIAIAPDDPLKMITHGWSSRDSHLYCWVSTDGGYSWPTPIDMGVIINPAYGGNCGPVLRWGTGGYVTGIYVNSAGGITNDGWPYFIESTDNGATWLPPVPLPVPQFDSTMGMFWWHEIEAEVINNKPWVLANDIGGTANSGMWLFIGSGTPGARTWQVYDMTIVGACSVSVADTLYIMKPYQYGSICHDPISGMTLVTYKAYGYIVQGGTNVLQDGACVGGAYTFNDGATWKVAHPLSDWQVGMTWAEWNGTETAHRLANIGGSIYVYTVWINNFTFDLYFEGGTTHNGKVWGGINEISNSNKRDFILKVSPTISANSCRIRFDLPIAESISLKLYDRSGRLVDELMNKQLGAGNHEISMDPQKYPAGVYFVALQTADGVQTAKIIISQ
jgi:hypothetical protein